MRWTALSALAGIALLSWTIPAAAAWNSYVSHPLGFSFRAPGEISVETGVYRAAVGGERQAIIYRSLDNNIDYRLSVVDFTDRADEGSVLMEEAAYILQDDMQVLLNDFGRVDTGADAVYGRRMTFDLPDGSGRKSVGTYFTKGRLFMIEATVLPENGDFATPDAGLFINSLVFLLSNADPDAIELPSSE
nr:MAG: hypothetical protein E4H34_02460 [Hyphomicrobiales bacterium]